MCPFDRLLTSAATRVQGNNLSVRFNALGRDNAMASRRLGHGKQPEELVSFDPAFVLRRLPVAAFGTVKVSEAAVMVSWFAQRCPDRTVR